MKMEFWYDPVLPEMRVEINGSPVNTEDAYGFLYPVQHYPLQNWLYPTGSWSGLACHIRDVARGERVDILFHGRKADSDDLRSAIEGPTIAVEYAVMDTLEEWKKRIEKAMGLLKGLLEEKEHSLLNPTAVALIDTLMAGPSEADWISRIDDEADFQQASRGQEDCCLVTPAFLTSLSALDRLDTLTRAMRRCDDMICCVHENVDTLEIFSRYAAQFSRMSYRFCTWDQWEEEQAQMDMKYGQPRTLRVQVKRLTDMAGTIQTAAMAEPDLKKHLTELSATLSNTPYGQEDRQLIKERNKIGSMVMWANNAKKTAEAIKETLRGVFG